MSLSPRESQCLTFICATIAATGRAPFQYEIAAHFGTKSRGFVWRVVKALEAKGVIRIRIKRPRGIEVVGFEARRAA